MRVDNINKFNANEIFIMDTLPKSWPSSTRRSLPHKPNGDDKKIRHRNYETPGLSVPPTNAGAGITAKEPRKILLRLRVTAAMIRHLEIAALTCAIFGPSRGCSGASEYRNGRKPQTL
jgi:hypothetical protein